MEEKNTCLISVKYSEESPDINENRILEADKELLSILLKDRTSGKNILWMTDNYASKGFGYDENSEITVERVTGKNGSLIKPRINKTKKEQIYRSRDKAEVFTPSWVCNQQNNLVDNQWFGFVGAFNSEVVKGWISNQDNVKFPEALRWQDYVASTRMEITCGEAPYLVSRYDTTTGQMLSVKDRIGLLDRKLRVVCENTSNKDDWKEWVIKAYQNVYGFEWQGDSLFLARENLILTLFDYFHYNFNNEEPDRDFVLKIAEIVSWNIWQMDGLKYVIPCSCHENKIVEADLFSETIITEACEGCKKDDVRKHNGIYCQIMDWEKNKKIKAITLFSGV